MLSNNNGNFLIRIAFSSSLVLSATYSSNELKNAVAFYNPDPIKSRINGGFNFPNGTYLFLTDGIDKSLMRFNIQNAYASSLLSFASDNKWICAPKLSWIYSWSEPYLKASILQNVSGTRCRYMDSKYDGQLFLVMEYYSKYVIPSCPTKDNCSCALTSVQEKLVHARERFYSVEVSCVGGGLSHFPKLPKHTRTVDLSQNKLNSRSFSFLKVEEHNYKDVDNLTLDKNRLQTLPEKLLDMKLGLSFSAKYNNLTSIPYDFSQRLMKTTAVIKMSNNPWKCTCTSEVTDLNLLVKIRDRDEMTCGPASDIQLKSKQITMLSPEMLCPPETSGEFQELLLQVLCVVLALLIVLVLARLAYDYWIYRTKGQLPWLALKMH